MTRARAAMGELELIRRLLHAAPMLRDDVLLGPGDDGALLRPPPGQALVVTTDTLIAGRHFPEETAAADVGYKALAVNLSDLAAMGAEPAWISVALSLPEADDAWAQAFIGGFFELLQAAGASLIGGDLTRGPLSVTVQALGLVSRGEGKVEYRSDGRRCR